MVEAKLAVFAATGNRPIEMNEEGLELRLTGAPVIDATGADGGRALDSTRGDLLSEDGVKVGADFEALAHDVLLVLFLVD